MVSLDAVELVVLVLQKHEKTLMGTVLVSCPENNLQRFAGIIAILNTEQAAQYGITQHDKISLIRKGEEYVVDVALSSEYVEPGTIGATTELLENYPIMP